MPKLSAIYDHVLHYTNWSGLAGILKSQSLWASHYKYLNDYSEITLFRNKLIDLTVPHVHSQFSKLIETKPGVGKEIEKEGGLGSVVRHDTEVLVDAQYHATGDEIYICSFCGLSADKYVNDNGLLSQWRGYGAGGGFALVFNTLQLEEMLEREVQMHRYRVMHFSDVVYSNDEEKLKEEFSDDLIILAKDVEHLFSLFAKHAKEEDANFKGFTEFVSCITRYKHHGFKEENEVRIVALPFTDGEEKLLEGDSNEKTAPFEKDRKFREFEDERIPYIELFNNIDERLPIEKIVVGPHKNRDKRVSTLKAMLRKHDIEVSCSDIPFVE